MYMYDCDTIRTTSSEPLISNSFFDAGPATVIPLHLLNYIHFVFILWYISLMKRLLVKASKSLSEDPDSRGHASAPAATLEYIIPPLPHPSPHDQVEIMATRDGLVLRPHIPGSKNFVCITWGKSVKIEEVTGMKHDWSKCTVIYGIIGILELYLCECPLLIKKATFVD